MQFLKQSWRGEKPLWRVFWVYGVYAQLIMFSLYIVGLRAHLPLFLHEVLVATIPFLLVYYPFYLVWFFVSLWRCAFNSMLPQWWGHVIRTAIVIITFVGAVPAIIFFVGFFIAFFHSPMH